MTLSVDLRFGTNKFDKMKQFFCVFALFVCSINAAHEVCWRDYVDAEIPFDAVLVKTGLYVAQIPLNGLIPASIYSGKREAKGATNDKTVEVNKGVKVLCSDNEDNFKWTQVTTGNAPSLTNAVRGGVEGGRQVYIGRVFHESQWKVGRYVPASNLLYVWTASGKAASVAEFELLEIDN